MSTPLDVADVVAAETGSAVVARAPVGGGCIDAAQRMALADGTTLFVKSSADVGDGRYAAEAAGLSWLAEAGALRVPAVVAVRDDPAPAFLALEWVPPGAPSRHTDERLGAGLAALHRAGAEWFGWDRPGFIGPLPQDNTPAPTWSELYGTRRLLPTAERAHRSGALPGDVRAGVEQVVERLDGLVGPPEPPARLHGDLWGGNVHVDEHGEPWLIDPAPYGGHREMDLAMLRLFGGPGPRAFAAYEEAHPLAPGADERVALWQLYPLLVHVVLFGAGYVGGVRRAVERYI